VEAVALGEPAGGAAGAGVAVAAVAGTSSGLPSRNFSDEPGSRPRSAASSASSSRRNCGVRVRRLMVEGVGTFSRRHHGGRFPRRHAQLSGRFATAASTNVTSTSRSL
jgi:hypothetical protein